MSIAIIPARGGSQRIPRKNIKLFKGVPVIAYAIKTARESDIFSEIFVSTEDEEIAEIAKSFGAKIPWMRPKNLSDNDTTTVSVIQDAVAKLKPSFDELEYVCCIYPATPLLQPKFLREGLQLIQTGEWDYAISASKARTPPQRFFSLDSENRVKMHYQEYEEIPTQNFSTSYHDSGQFYFGKTTSWEYGFPIFSSRTTIVEIPYELSVDIDTLEDWHYAEHLFNFNTGEQS